MDRETDGSRLRYSDLSGEQALARCAAEAEPTTHAPAPGPALESALAQLMPLAWRRPAIGYGLGAAALVCAYTAHLHGRPISAALIALFGVVGVGGMLGLRAGAIAGFCASVTYNLLFTDPVLRFSFSSVDDLLPFVALNLSAIASGAIAGRLHDRAVAAETSERRVSELLCFSQDLQRVITLGEIEAIIAGYFGGSPTVAQLYVERSQALETSGREPWGQSAAEELWGSRMPALTCGPHMGFLLKSGDRRLGVLVVRGDQSDRTAAEVQVFLPSLTLAIQRCLLAEQLAESAVISRSEKFKTALLSSVSHDLRTPIAAISASAGSLLQLGSELDEQSRRGLLATIDEQCGRLDRLTSNLLALGRIEGGLQVFNMPIVDAIEVLGGTLSRIRGLSGDHVINRDFALPSASVRADEALLEQVFYNVLENAVMHTPAGTSIKVSAHTSGTLLLIAVEDDGPGIPAHARERIFDRFYQLASGPRGRNGSGLGLSIAKGFTELVGGRISASRPRGMRGARIEVVLPLMGIQS